MTNPNPDLVNRLMRSIGEVTSPAWVDEHQGDLRRAIENELMPRAFEARGTITIDYAMGFSEAEAREWFPDARWDEENVSIAGEIEDLIAQGKAPDDFWSAVLIKREVVISMETKHDGRRPPETLSVGEL